MPGTEILMVAPLKRATKTSGLNPATGVNVVAPSCSAVLPKVPDTYILPEASVVMQSAILSAVPADTAACSTPAELYFAINKFHPELDVLVSVILPKVAVE